MSTSNAARSAEHPIDIQFLNRWSPRAFTEETIPESTLLTFFEAARWASPPPITRNLGDLRMHVAAPSIGRAFSST